jgi:predicted nuclease of restriction endonuclease-like (RecB) superfamily
MSADISILDESFNEVYALIQKGKRAFSRQANSILIETYWSIGRYLSEKIALEKWGKGTITTLSEWLTRKGVDARGFSPSNLWRMRQLYDLYSADEKLAQLVRELSWTNNLIIMGRCKTPEERAFYIERSISANWPKRELERQIGSSAYERTALSSAKLAPAVRDLPQNVGGVFKDSYLIDFVDLPDIHQEKDRQSALVTNLRKFLLELGAGFSFIGEKVRIQVGKKDFELDLLFFHRDLQCMVAFELKTGDFEPSHVGQLAFYLEALDRQQKRPHEKPSIGVLLCKSKDDEVVELALSKTLAPALVSEYETKLIPKELLRRKLHEWSELLEDAVDND